MRKMLFVSKLPMMRRLLVFLLLLGSVGAQIVPTDPNLQAWMLASGVPGGRHQVGTDAAGNI